MMKALTFCALLLTSIQLQASPVDASPNSSRNRNTFVFTAERCMRGAVVKVYHANGDLVTSQRLRKRRMVIDFCDVPTGSYTIVVENEKKREEFQFERR